MLRLLRDVGELLDRGILVAGLVTCRAGEPVVGDRRLESPWASGSRAAIAPSRPARASQLVGVPARRGSQTTRSNFLRTLLGSRCTAALFARVGANSGGATKIGESSRRAPWRPREALERGLDDLALAKTLLPNLARAEQRELKALGRLAPPATNGARSRESATCVSWTSTNMNSLKYRVAGTGNPAQPTVIIVAHRITLWRPRRRSPGSIASKRSNDHIPSSGASGSPSTRRANPHRAGAPKRAAHRRGGSASRRASGSTAMTSTARKSPVSRSFDRPGPSIQPRSREHAHAGPACGLRAPPARARPGCLRSPRLPKDLDHHARITMNPPEGPLPGEPGTDARFDFGDHRRSPQPDGETPTTQKRSSPLAARKAGGTARDRARSPRRDQKHPGDPGALAIQTPPRPSHHDVDDLARDVEKFLMGLPVMCPATLASASRGAPRFALGASGASVMRPRTLPFTCTAISITSSTAESLVVGGPRLVGERSS